MKNLKNSLEELKSINEAYKIPNDDINKLEDEIEKSKVCIPVIGRFSSGKSALVNTVLGYNRKILKEDITPETAIPAEIVYTNTEECVNVIENDGKVKNISVDEYRNFEADATTVKSARINLRNSFLEKIPDVMIVDMPGFESGYEVHNKAIDNYLNKSMAYIIAFPADDMIVRNSVGDILRELCLHDMNICVVITKYDKRNVDEYEEALEKMKESLKKFVGNREITYCETSSFKGEAEELKDFLLEIQNNSENIITKNHLEKVLEKLGETENSLKTALNSSGLSDTELAEKEEKIKSNLENLESKFQSRKKSFESEISSAVSEIQGDIKCALEAEEPTFVAMALNNQNISERLNIVVRSATAKSVKNRFIEKVEKYLEDVSECINSEAIGDVHITFNFDASQINKNITSDVVAFVASLIPIIGPIFSIIYLFKNAMGDKKRAEAKQQIRQKLRNEAYPQVLMQVSNNIEKAITKNMGAINNSIEKTFSKQKEILVQTLDEVRKNLNDEKEKREQFEIDAKRDLERIGEIKNELR